MNPKQDACIELLQKFPNAKTHTLARMLYEKNRLMFNSVESARSLIRYYRGAHGSENFKYVRQDFIRAKQTSTDPFSKLPEGITHFDSWKSFDITGRANALVLSDTHIPYHTKGPIINALKFGRDNGVNLIILNGDAADFFACSFWEKDPRKRHFAEELKTVREFLAALRESFPKARIVYKQGNHEERWERYMSVKAPELLGVDEFRAEQVMQLDKHGIEWVNEKRPIKLGMLNIVHGHEHKFAISNPVNPARGLFLRSKVHCLGAHFHQTSEHNEKTLEQNVVSTWSSGCLCDLHPDYMPINNWNHGFAFIDLQPDGTFRCENLKIVGGTVY